MLVNLGYFVMDVYIYHYNEYTSVVQTAGLSSPLHCDSGGAEWGVSVPCSWIQEGKKHLFLFCVTCVISSCANDLLILTGHSFHQHR